MEGTFPKIKPAGYTNDQPDFYSGPDAIPADEVAILQEVVNATATTMRVKYLKHKRGRLETLRKKRMDGQVLTVAELAEAVDFLLGVK